MSLVYDLDKRNNNKVAFYKNDFISRRIFFFFV
jgi:hypothetical protein